jgi:hypothetical protein
MVLGLLQCVLRDQGVRTQLLLARVFGARVAGLGACGGNRFLGTPERRLGRGDLGLGAGLAARVQHLGAQRLQQRQGLALAHVVPDVQFDALQVTGHRRGDHVAVLDAGLAFLLDHDAQRAAFDYGHLHQHRARPEAPGQCGQQGDGQGDQADVSGPAHGNSFLIRQFMFVI